jgi:hypothetical protein
MIFLFIHCLSLAPIPGTYDANRATSIRKTHREDASLNLSEAIETFFELAVSEVSGDYAIRVGERQLGFEERDMMLGKIRQVLAIIPLEVRQKVYQIAIIFTIFY